MITLVCQQPALRGGQRPTLPPRSPTGSRRAPCVRGPTASTTSSASSPGAAVAGPPGRARRRARSRSRRRDRRDGWPRRRDRRLHPPRPRRPPALHGRQVVIDEAEAIAVCARRSRCDPDRHGVRRRCCRQATAALFALKERPDDVALPVLIRRPGRRGRVRAVRRRSHRQRGRAR